VVLSLFIQQASSRVTILKIVWTQRAILHAVDLSIWYAIFARAEDAASSEAVSETIPDMKPWRAFDFLFDRYRLHNIIIQCIRLVGVIGVVSYKDPWGSGNVLVDYRFGRVYLC
jgi:hypothetical protein